MDQMIASHFLFAGKRDNDHVAKAIYMSLESCKIELLEYIGRQIMETLACVSKTNQNTECNISYLLLSTITENVIFFKRLCPHFAEQLITWNCAFIYCTLICYKGKETLSTDSQFNYMRSECFQNA